MTLAERAAGNEKTGGAVADSGPVGVVLDVLANDRRRYVIDVLESDPNASLGDLADALTAAEVGSGFDSQERKCVYVALYQTHLPKMDFAGIVEFDEDRSAVERGPRFDDAVAALRSVRAQYGFGNDPGRVRSVLRRMLHGRRGWIGGGA